MVRESVFQPPPTLLITHLGANRTTWSNTLKQFVGKSMFDHFVGLALKVLRPLVYLETKSSALDFKQLYIFCKFCSVKQTLSSKRIKHLTDI